MALDRHFRDRSDDRFGATTDLQRGQCAEAMNLPRIDASSDGSRGFRFFLPGEFHELPCFFQFRETQNMAMNNGIATIESAQAIWKYTVLHSIKVARRVISLE